MTAKTVESQPAGLTSDRMVAGMMNAKTIANDIERACDRVFTLRNTGACVVACTDMSVRITRHEVCVGTTIHTGLFEGAFCLYDRGIVHVHIWGAFGEGIVLEVKACDYIDCEVVGGRN